MKSFFSPEFIRKKSFIFVSLILFFPVTPPAAQSVVAQPAQEAQTPPAQAQGEPVPDQNVAEQTAGQTPTSVTPPVA